MQRRDVEQKAIEPDVSATEPISSTIEATPNATKSSATAKKVVRDESVKARVVHCKRDPYDIYIGRGRGSIWGNPFVIPRDGDRDRVLAKYKQYLLDDVDMVAYARRVLRDKTLGCWCAPKPCHGDILWAVANDRPLPF